MYILCLLFCVCFNLVKFEIEVIARSIYLFNLLDIVTYTILDVIPRRVRSIHKNVKIFGVCIWTFTFICICVATFGKSNKAVISFNRVEPSKVGCSKIESKSGIKNGVI